MTLDNEQDLWYIVWGDHPDYRKIQEVIAYQSRWSVRKELIVENTLTGGLLSISYDSPATEQQETDPNFVVIPVVPKTVTTTIYVEEE